MTDQNNDKIKLKIRALLSKSMDSGVSEAEAMSFLEGATRLMMQYRFTKEELSDPLLGSRCFLKKTPLIQIGYKTCFFYTQLARLFDCEHFYNKNNITFFGIDQDPDLCIYFYNLIIRACAFEVHSYKNSIEYKFDTAECHGRMVISAFVKGFLSRINAKLNEMYRQRKSCLETDNALIVLKDKKVESEFKKLNFKIRTVKTNMTVKHEDAFSAGEQRAERVQLVRGVSGFENESRKLLSS